MTQQTITSLFDTREHANQAVLMLKQAGVPDSAIIVSPETAATDYTQSSDVPAKGFWASLEEMFGDTDDHYTYTEGLRRGGTMVTAHVDDSMVDKAVSILEEHGSVDMNEKETTWRNEGWTGATAMTAGRLASERTVSSTTSTPAAVMDSTLTAPVATQSVRQNTGEDVLQVVEEQLEVGKRAVNRGKVRLHSYVVEKAVSDSVTLRDETISIDRRPVDRILSSADVGVDAFKDRTIEMDQIGEEAVVGKTTRVVEEIGIRKDAADRVQTINDTVRSTKVDIDDDRTTSTSTSHLMGDFSSELANDMDVVGSDGQHVGVIDHVDGTMIKLKRLDPASGGSHHLIPTAWVESVDGKVMLKTSAADVKSRWTAA